MDLVINLKESFAISETFSNFASRKILLHNDGKKGDRFRQKKIDGISWISVYILERAHCLFDCCCIFLFDDQYMHGHAVILE